MIEECKVCPSYKSGRGSKKCLNCPKFARVTSRQRPCIEYIQIEKEMLENLSLPLQVDYYNILDTKEAIILFMRYHLKLTLKDIALHHNISHQAVDKKIKNIIIKLNTYRENKLY